jgi:hypothetical protein
VFNRKLTEKKSEVLNKWERIITEMNYQYAGSLALRNLRVSLNNARTKEDVEKADADMRHSCSDVYSRWVARNENK